MKVRKGGSGKGAKTRKNGRRGVKNGLNNITRSLRNLRVNAEEYRPALKGLKANAEEYRPASKSLRVNAEEYRPSNLANSVSRLRLNANAYVPTRVIDRQYELSRLGRLIKQEKGITYNNKPSPIRNVVALDCEMITTKKDRNALASVSIIDYDGTVNTFYVHYPHSDVIDYKTKYSGITREILDKMGVPLKKVLEYVKLKLYNKRIVGHQLDSDFRALKITVPDENIWDTSRIKEFMSAKTEKNPNGTNVFDEDGEPIYKTNMRGNLIYLPKKLQKLAKNYLARNIQMSELGHDPAEDAMASLDLYKWAEVNAPELVPDLDSIVPLYYE